MHQSLLLIILCCISSIEPTTLPSDVSAIQFLRSFWSLDVLLSWPDPNTIDPCDFAASDFPEIDCRPNGAFDTITALAIDNVPLNLPIPPEIINLQNLLLLELTSCSITGNLPPLSPLPLLDLILSNNQITGPLPDFSQFPVLTSIILDNNMFTGTIPNVGTTIMIAFIVRSNDLEGEIPLAIFQSSELISLDVANNRLTGLIPNILSPGITFLALSNNEFYGFLSDTFLADDPGYATVLNQNPFACPNPAWCSAFLCRDCLPPQTNQRDEDILAELSVSWGTSWNLLDDPCNVPSSYPTITCNEINPVDKRITSIEVIADNLTGNIPISIVDLDFLISLNLSGNSLSGSIPPEIGNLPALETLILASNNFDGQLFPFLHDAIQMIDFRNNNIQGEIPVSYGNLPQLRFLDLSFNQLLDRIPTSFTSTILEYLSLEDNNLFGLVPASLGSMTNLQTLLLGVNNLSGNLPDQLGNPSNRIVVNGNLMAVDLKNTFWGTQPPFVYDLRNNRWHCSLPNHCTENPLGNGLCEPCIPSASDTPTITPSATPPPSRSSTSSVSFTNTPTRTRSSFQSQSSSNTITASMTPSQEAESSTSPIPVSSSPSPSTTQTKSSTPTQSTSRTPPESDCNGIPGGSAFIDECGVCGGNNRDFDDCGVCNGNNDCLLITDSPFNWNEPCIDFKFNEATDRAEMNFLDYDCRGILRSSTIKKLGIGSYCYWKSDCVVVVCEGNRANLMPGDFVEFLPVIHSQVSGSLLYSTSVITNLVSEANKPIAVLNGPEIHAACGEIVLDASYSISSIGRGLIYTWKYVNPQNEHRSEVREAIESSLATGNEFVALNPQFWRVGATYEFQVIVTNEAGISESSNILNVNIVQHTVPEIEILASRRLYSVDVSLDITFFSKFTFSECSSSTSDPLYHWQVISLGDGMMLHTKTDFLDSSLYLPSYTLSSGQMFNITLTVSDGQYTSSTYTVIDTIEGKICAKISKGSRNVQLEDLLLDGSETVDTMNEKQNFRWQWKCFTLNHSSDFGQTCEPIRVPCRKPSGEVFELPEEEFLRIPANWLAFGIYYFSLDASKGERSGFDQVSITVQSKTTKWNAWINSPICDFRRGETLIVEGHCDDGDLSDDDEHLSSYRWFSTIPIDSSTSTTLSTNKILVLDGFAFSQFPSYPNSLTLVCNNEQSMYKYYSFINNTNIQLAAQWNFPTDQIPSGGSFDVSPKFGIACVDTFEFIAYDWLAFEPQRILFYQFSYLDEFGKEFFLTEPTSMSNRISVVLPQGNLPGDSLEVFLTVRDEYGAAQRISRQIQVFPSTDSSARFVFDSIENTRRLLLQNDFSRTNAQLQCLASEIELNEEIVHELLLMIDYALHAQCTPSIIRNQVNTIKKLSQQPSERNMELILEIFANNERCFVGAPDTTFFDATDVISNIFDIELSAGRLHEARCFVEILRGIRTLPRSCGEQLEDIRTKNIRIQSQIEFTQKGESNESVKFDFAEDSSGFSVSSRSLSKNSDSFGNCFVGDFTVYSIDPFQSDEGDVVAFTNSLVFHNLGSEDEISFNNLDDPILVSVQRSTDSGSSDLTCVYYDNGRWKDDGVQLVSIENERIICESNHLTDFSVLLGANLDSSDDGSAENLVLWILSAIFIGIALILIVIVILLFIQFPSLRKLILHGERPGAEKLRNELRVAKMKRRTMEQYGLTADPAL